jgi:hypothetical protein
MTERDDDQEPHPDRHDTRSTTERLGLLERDVRSHARSLTAIVAAGKEFTSEQMDQLRTVFREELADAGLRIDGPDHIDDARRDFMFLRSLRVGLNGTASKIGWVVIAAILGAVIWLVTNGLNFWKGH